MRIPYLDLAFTSEADDPLVLPAYKGSALRGGFGAAFRRIACALRRTECADCLLRTRCIYAYVFETPPREGTTLMGMGKYEKVPHPYIIEPPLEHTRVWQPSERLTFHLILVGRARDYLPYFVLTFDELGRTGLGKGKGTFHLVSVAADGVDIYDRGQKTLKPAASREIEVEIETGGADASRVTIRFLTPLRMLHQRRLATELPFHVLIRSLMRRIGLIHYFHCEGREPSWDHKALLREAEGVRTVGSSLHWWDWERYSTRQKTRLRMGGLKGEVTYEGKIGPFLPILRAGEVLHAGKGTSFGLGKYVITVS